MMNRLLKNEYVFSVLTKILMVFVGFAHSVAIARFLGAELKGIMSSTQSIVNILAIIIIEDIEIFKALLSAKNDEWIKK